ncbi:DUF6178 family protein [Chlamydiota bacterium]
MNEQSVHFEELDFKTQCDLVSQSPLSEKGDYIIRSQDPGQLIVSLAPEELLLIAKESDEDTVPELLSYANTKQIIFFGDMLIWQKDTISKQKFLDYLSSLLEADITKLFEWLTIVDHEALLVGFKKLITIYKTYDIDDTVEERFKDSLVFTLDGYYYIRVEENNFDIIKRSLETLYSNSPRIYINLLEGVLSESLPVTQETAYTHRQERLNEKGFPEPEEAYRIYKPLTIKELSALEKRDPLTWKNISLANIEQNNENLFIKKHTNTLFFDDVLLSLMKSKMHIKDSIQQELFSLANKIVAIAGMEYSDQKALKKGIEQAHSFINIGLEYLSKKDILTAQKIIVEHWLEDIFRIGYTYLTSLREKTLEIFSVSPFNSVESFTRFLEDPLQGIIRGALKKIPLYYKGGGSSLDIDYRNFNDLDEIQKTVQSVQGLLWIFDMLKSKDPFWNKTVFPHQQTTGEITLNTLVLTMFINFVTDRNHLLNSITVKRFKLFLKNCDCFKKKELSIPEKKYRQDFVALLMDTKDTLFGTTTLINILNKSREEYFSLFSNDSFDQRFLSFFLLKN